MLFRDSHRYRQGGSRNTSVSQTSKLEEGLIQQHTPASNILQRLCVVHGDFVIMHRKGVSLKFFPTAVEWECRVN